MMARRLLRREVEEGNLPGHGGLRLRRAGTIPADSGGGKPAAGQKKPAGGAGLTIPEGVEETGELCPVFCCTATKIFHGWQRIVVLHGKYGIVPPHQASPDQRGREGRASPRSTSRAARLPALPTRSFRCSGLLTALPSSETMMSPGRRPARAAAPRTSWTTAPPLISARRASSGVRALGGHAQAPAGGAGRRLGRGEPVVLELAHLDVHTTAPALAPYLEAGGTARRQRRHGGGQFHRTADGLAVDGQDDVAGFQTCRAAGPPFSTALTRAPAGRLRPKDSARG